MKLYYAPGACSLAPHIVAREAGLKLDLDKLDFATRTTQSGEAYVPALRLDDGAVLTEVATLVQYLADQAPQSGLAPANGTIARYRLQEWLTFISSEIHKGFGPLWNPALPDASKDAAKAHLAKRFAYLEGELKNRAYLTGERFSAADAYLFTVMNWAAMHSIDLGPYPTLKAYMDRVAARPAVRQALEAEGLLKQAA
jgi:glutathione S-transferase